MAKSLLNLYSMMPIGLSCKIHASRVASRTLNSFKFLQASCRKDVGNDLSTEISDRAAGAERRIGTSEDSDELKRRRSCL